MGQGEAKEHGTRTLVHRRRALPRHRRHKDGRSGGGAGRRLRRRRKQAAQPGDGEAGGRDGGEHVPAVGQDVWQCVQAPVVIGERRRGGGEDLSAAAEGDEQRAGRGDATAERGALLISGPGGHGRAGGQPRLARRRG